MNFESLIKNLEQMADTKQTPFLVHSERVLEGNWRAMMAGFSQADLVPSVYYAVKSCYARPVLQTLARLGCGAEVMSPVEFQLALSCGFDPKNIIVNGLGKRPELIAQAVKLGSLFVVDSLADARAIAQEGQAQGKVVPIGVRVLPQKEPWLQASAYGNPRNKLGLVPGTGEWTEVMKSIQGHPHLQVQFLHAHAAINQRDAKVHTQVLEWVAGVWEELETHWGFKDIHTLNLGGGFGTFAADEWPLAQTLFSELGQRFHARFPRHRLALEPGRYLSNSSGFVVTRVLMTKNGIEDFHHVVVDATTSTLIPIPSARYRLLAPKPTLSGALCAVVDGITSPDNVILESVALDKVPAVGDVMVLGNCGAYTSVLQHFWALDPMPQVWLSSDGEAVDTVDAALMRTCRQMLLGV